MPACSRLDHMRGSGSVAAVTDHPPCIPRSGQYGRLCMVCARSPRPDQLITRAPLPHACDPSSSQQLISPLHVPLGGRGHQPVPLRRTHSSSVRGVFFPLRSNRSASGVPGVPLSLKLVNLKKTRKQNTAFTRLHVYAHSTMTHARISNTWRRGACRIYAVHNMPASPCTVHSRLIRDPVVFADPLRQRH